MIEHGDTVNTKKRYHHGDLRAALLREGLRLLAERDAEGISLREVARAVGVSATAVYRHFPDKTALLTALAREGLARLAAAQRAASDAEGGGAPGFAATGRAYVRFALTEPALFRLTFASAPAQQPGDSDAYRLLRDNAAAELKRDASPREIDDTALRYWSLAHGIAMLMLDGMLPADEKLIDRLI